MGPRFRKDDAESVVTFTPTQTHHALDGLRSANVIVLTPSSQGTDHKDTAARELKIEAHFMISSDAILPRSRVKV
jgi:hypothetical protein